MKRTRSVFYGWWIVGACFLTATVSWSLGVFGTSVYLHMVHQQHGWSIASISAGSTLFYLVGALLSFPVARSIVQFGPTPVALLGAIALAIGVIGMGRVADPWHVQAAFVILGVSYACLGATAISTTLAPWFERHQGRAVASALMGASAGGVIGAPLLLSGTALWGFSTTTLLAGMLALATIAPIALFVLKQRPEELGLLPDGDPPGIEVVNAERHWGQWQAFKTPSLISVVVAFGAALSMQVGFLTHHVALITPEVGPSVASATVSATGIAGLFGRLALSKYADQIHLRSLTSVLLAVGAACFAFMALLPNKYVFVGASVVFGFTLGNITSLSPIIVRREFGAASFGPLYGSAAMLIGILSAFGPSAWGLLHDLSGGYSRALLAAAALDALAAGIILIRNRELNVYQPTP